MSTYYRHFGGVSIKEVIEITNWKIGIQENPIDVNTAIEKKYFYLTNGKHYLWLNTNSYGEIISFTRYGDNNASFLIDLIGNTISEYDFEEGIINCDDEDELSEWIEENTFFEELEKEA
ncbi:hypothetical protein [Flavobacterium sp.]|uniref:hypothetical protein n=1 Tax=Flavobacterium sp. TaxID=239 RepID=UPI00286F5FAA|nr:hypothetical protein [Flavobacterium sp.]